MPSPLGLEPERVDLYAGTRDGARALRLGRERIAMALDELPFEFGRLPPAEGEDCLCIYKSEIRCAVKSGVASCYMPYWQAAR